MNICLLVSSMEAGGAERVAASLSNSWLAGGYRVILIVTYSHRGNCVYELDSGVELIYLADQLAGQSSRFFGRFRRILALRKIIKIRKPDVVVSFLTNVNVSAIVAAFGLAVPVVVAEHSYPPKMPIVWWLDVLRNMTYPFASAVVMLTTKGLQWLQAGFASVKGVVIPNPAVFPLLGNHPFRQPHEHFPEDRKLVLSVGRLAPEKQVDHQIRAFSSLVEAHPDWDLAIVGDGPLLAELTALVENLHLSQRIKFTGRAGNVGDWYTRADLFVLSSLFEGFPNTLVEAMAHGCAVVSYDCDTGPRDIVRDGVDGLLVNPAAGAGGLAAAMGRLMDDTSQRRRLAEAAPSVRARFGLPEVLDMWEALFLDVMGRRSR